MYRQNVQIECTDRMYRQDKQTECTDKMYRQNVQTECTDRMYRQNVRCCMYVYVTIRHNKMYNLGNNKHRL